MLLVGLIPPLVARAWRCCVLYVHPVQKWWGWLTSRSGHAKEFASSPPRGRGYKLSFRFHVEGCGNKRLALTQNRLKRDFSFSGKELRVLFPLEGPGSHRGGNTRKMGKNYKIPLPGPTPENGEKLQKNCKNCIFRSNFTPFLGQFFPIFRGRTGEGNFVIFPHFSGISAPGPSKGKNNSQAKRHKSDQKWPLEAPQVTFEPLWLSSLLDFAEKGVLSFESPFSQRKDFFFLGL